MAKLILTGFDFTVTILNAPFLEGKCFGEEGGPYGCQLNFFLDVLRDLLFRQECLSPFVLALGYTLA